MRLIQLVSFHSTVLSPTSPIVEKKSQLGVPEDNRTLNQAARLTFAYPMTRRLCGGTKGDLRNSSTTPLHDDVVVRYIIASICVSDVQRVLPGMQACDRTFTTDDRISHNFSPSVMRGTGRDVRHITDGFDLQIEALHKSG